MAAALQRMVYLLKSLRSALVLGDDCLDEWIDDDQNIDYFFMGISVAERNYICSLERIFYVRVFLLVNLGEVFYLL